MISGFDCTKDVNRGDIRARESAIVNNLFDASSGRSDLRGKISQSSRSITDDSRESTQTTVSDEATFDDSAQHIRINVSAAVKEDDSFPD